MFCLAFPLYIFSLHFVYLAKWKPLMLRCKFTQCFSNACCFHSASHKHDFVTIVGVSQCNQYASHVNSIDTSNAMEIQASVVVEEEEEEWIQQCLSYPNQFKTLLDARALKSRAHCIWMWWRDLTLYGFFIRLCVLLWVHNRTKSILLNEKLSQRELNLCSASSSVHLATQTYQNVCSDQASTKNGIQNKTKWQKGATNS